ncbi:MAG: PEP-CTERM sorting domain-containing protein [Acidobacteria bacterium]|nr:PEP-CTERM sorting domain-containing protein [Acidobacteriota bacterium]
MLRKKLFKILLSLSLLIAFTAVSGIAVKAEETKTQRKTKRCDIDYDRNALDTDEERTYGDCNETVPTPEPVSILLFSAGLAGVGFAARRRLRKSE